MTHQVLNISNNFVFLHSPQDYFSNNANADKISKVKEQVDEVQQIMVQNIERVLERGERLELLVVCL